MVFGQNVTERHRAHNPSPLPCPAAGPGAGRPLRAPVRAAAGSPTCCKPRVGRWPLGGGTARNSRALGCSRVQATHERERDSLGRHVAMRGRAAVVPPSGVGARQRLRFRSVDTQAAGGVRRDPPAARRAAGAAARHTGRARARPTRAAAGAVTRGRRTAIVALRHLLSVAGCPRLHLKIKSHRVV